VATFGKIQPFLAELRAASREPDLAAGKPSPGGADARSCCRSTLRMPAARVLKARKANR
jgi:hypothetical protein